MKAIIYKEYGSPDVLQFAEIEKPIPKDKEVLIKVHATTVTSGDWRVRSLDIPYGFKFLSRLIFGFNRPKQPILGTELSGIIESVGKDVSKFKVGDSVFAFNDLTMGSYTEYKCMSEDGAIALKPSNLSFEEAAALSFGGSTALSFFHRGKLLSGEKILINGASGGVGTAAIQLAKCFGIEVTAVCSAANFELVKSLGAKYMIDYTKEDFRKNGKTYDAIMDTTGTVSFASCKDSLNPKGRFLMVLGDLPAMLQIPFFMITSSKKIIAGPAVGNAIDLQFLAKLAETGEFKPYIEKVYSFDQMVEAHRHVDTGRKRGNIVIKLS